MHPIRKFLIAALAVVYVPFTVLASAPLVVCAHADGTTKIEISHSKLCAAEIRKEWRGFFSARSGKNAFSRKGCRDSQLVAANWQASGETKAKASGSAPPPVLFIVGAEFLAPTETIKGRSFVLAGGRVDPRLVHRATTVLLI